MNLDEIKLMWESDCEIDDIELDNASLEVPKLHAKYLDLLSSKLMVQKQYQMKYDTLLRDKWLWYNGKLDDETRETYGWAPDALDGVRVMKNEMHHFFNADKDLQELSAKMEYLKITVDFIKECMQNITWRHQTIKNTIDWRKFMAGS